MTAGIGDDLKPRIAVVITTRNHSAILERSLEKLFASTLPPGGFELAVADDGSSDGTAEFLRSVKAPPGIVFRAESYPAVGGSHGLNAAIRMTTADLILILGDDSFVPPGLVAAHCEGLEKLADPDVVLVGRMKWSATQLPSRFRDWLDGGIIHRQPDTPKQGFASPRYFFTLNATIHRSLWERVGGFPEEIPCWIDTVFAFRGASLGMKLYFDPGLLVEHHHEWSLESYAARQMAKGVIAARLLAEEPSFSRFVKIPMPGLRRTVMSRASTTIYPLARACRIRFLEEWYFGHQVNKSFIRGFQEGSRS